MVGQVESEDFEDLKVTASVELFFLKNYERKTTSQMDYFSDFFQG